MADLERRNIGRMELTTRRAMSHSTRSLAVIGVATSGNDVPTAPRLATHKQVVKR